MRKHYTASTIYHPTPEHKAKFQEEVLKRFSSLSAFARAVADTPELIFNEDSNV